MSSIKTRIATGFGATVIAAGMFTGIGAGFASAETPTGGHSACSNGNTGYACDTPGGMGPKERACYVGAGKGGVLGGFGGVAGAASGAAAGCFAGAVGWAD